MRKPVPPSPITRHLADCLAALRRSKGVSLSEVQHSTGVSKTHLWELESGGSINPTVDMVRRLATFYGVSLTLLLEPRTQPSRNAVTTMVIDLVEQMNEDEQQALLTLLRRGR